MQPPFTISQIIQIAEICQYLAVVDIKSRVARTGGDLNQKQARLIYMERKALQNAYNLNAFNPALPGISNYVFSLCRNWQQAVAILNAQSIGPPAITNPSNVNIVAGQNAVFTVAVTSSIPYTLQWYRNAVIIPGATGLSYTLVGAQLTDSGSLFKAIATNSAGSTSSLAATLTVTSPLSANWWWGPSDPYPALSGGTDTLVYQITETITGGQPITIDYSGQSGAENNQFNVLRYPVTEADKTAWFNTTVNQGAIPDSVMRPVLNANGYKYVVSRNLMSLDPTNTTLKYS